MRLIWLAAFAAFGALIACSPAKVATATTGAQITANKETTTTPSAPPAWPVANPRPRSTTTGDINVAAPAPNSRTPNPLIATGTAPNSWYFEAQFRAELISQDGHVIAEAPALAQTDWTKEGPVAFRVEMAYSVPSDMPATLLLQEDMPPDADHPSPRPTKEIRIPVVLSAAR
jgi:hypothetical protein